MLKLLNKVNHSQQQEKKEEKTSTIHSITKPSPRFPDGVTILSNPRSGARRQGDPRLISGFLF
jgi:hypothetical protein